MKGLGALMAGLVFLIAMSGSVSAATYTVCSSGCDYATIQSAVDAASDGDKIQVKKGSYEESVYVDKSLKIIGAGASDTEVIGGGSDAFYVEADDVTITGFKISDADSGIYLDGVSGCDISDNVVVESNYGVYLDYSNNNNIVGNEFSDNYDAGVGAYHSSDNNIENNFISNYWDGVTLEYSSNNNRVVNNIISESGHWGLRIFYSDGNHIEGNDISESWNDGINIQHADGNRIANNIINSNGGDGIEAFYIDENVIEGNTISQNVLDNVVLHWSSYNVVDNNVLSYSQYSDGIALLFSSNNNVIKNNDVIGNDRIGIYLGYGPENNVISHNNIINNGWEQALEVDYWPPPPSKNNSWYNPILLEGNYWSDYTGVDDGSGTGKHAIAGDGIGDTDIPWPPTPNNAYAIPIQDYYPFMVENGWVGDKNKGHGNDPDGVDEDNPGKGCIKGNKKNC